MNPRFEVIMTALTVFGLSFLQPNFVRADGDLALTSFVGGVTMLTIAPPLGVTSLVIAVLAVHQQDKTQLLLLQDEAKAYLLGQPMTPALDEIVQAVQEASVHEGLELPLPQNVAAAVLLVS